MTVSNVTAASENNYNMKLRLPKNPTPGFYLREMTASVHTGVLCSELVWLSGDSRVQQE